MKARFALWSLLAWGTTLVAGAADWPKGYIVMEGSASPDGRYGILIPSRDLAEEELTDYVADLKAHRTLGKITGAEYFEGQNHSGMIMTWADDSSWGVLEWEGRWGFDKLWVLEVGGKSLVTRDIGDRIHKMMAKVIGDQQRGEEGDTTLNYTANDDRTLRVHGTNRTNPKGFEDQKTYCGIFTGVYSLKKAQWSRAEGRAVTEREHDALEYAWGYVPGDAARDVDGIRDAQEKMRLLDEKLNQIYLALKFLLPTPKFSEVKQAQIAWLKKRDALSGESKLKFVGERIDELAKMVPE